MSELLKLRRAMDVSVDGRDLVSPYGAAIQSRPKAFGPRVPAPNRTSSQIAAPSPEKD
jgi:hypothetical protein